MNIRFDATGDHRNVDRVTTAYESAARESEKTGGSAYTMDISGIVMDNNAYTGHGKTAEDVMQDMGNENLTWERNYMTVMSNSMSDEDFARLQKEGFHPGSTEIGTVVTIVDKIKAALAASGTEVAGYTDTLDLDTLTEITGSAGMAAHLVQEFHRADVPVTRENVEAVAAAVAAGMQLETPSDGAVKYLVENELEPTLDHLYVAEHAGAADASRQGRGYYAAGSGAYLAKKAEDFDWAQLTPQIQKVMEQADLAADDTQAMEEAKWLLENGMELTAENLSRLDRIRNLSLPADGDALAQAAIAALADGKKTGEAVPGYTESFNSRAAALMQAVDSLTEEAADRAAANRASADQSLAEAKDLTLRELLAAQKRLENRDSVLPNLKARRQLEEVRLRMTVEANRLLLKSGFSIDTAPMEELIERLKEAEQTLQNRLFADGYGKNAETKAALYERTLDTVSWLYRAPAAVIGPAAQAIGTMTLSGLEDQAKSMQTAYEKAGVSYEALMTEVRSDLGDSIRKAFRNVDDILEDLGLEAAQDNRRAVRILGYNQMEISRENIELVRAADSSVQKILKKMTPASVLQMIRDGENPLAVSMEELSAYLDGQSDTPEKDAEKYSKFLYQLEKDQEISEEEKTSFIGIYRMMRTLEKDDGAAIGAMLSQGTELTFSNLLTAVRSRRKGAMDYRVDDSFGGMEAGTAGRPDISSQINSAYAQNLVETIYENLSPDEMKQAGLQMDMTLAQAADALREAHKTQRPEAEEGFLQEEAARMREASRVQDHVLESLLEHHIPVTADNLNAAQAYMLERGSSWRAIYDRSVRNDRKKELEEKAEQLTEAFTSGEAAKEAYENLTEAAQDVLREAEFVSKDALDVRQMAMLYKQLSFGRSMAEREEYEIPVSIAGEMTSIHLSIRQPREQEAGGQVVITCKTQKLGNVAGEFQIREEQASVSGYIACENETAGQYFSRVKDVLAESFAESGLTDSSIQIVNGQTVQLSRFEKTGETKQTSDSRLYQTAKQFLTALKTIERG